MAVNMATGGGNGGSIYKGAVPPDSTDETWLYTGNDENNHYGKNNVPLIRGGVYFNVGTDVTKNWEPTVAVWA